jgi:hypothetical protein
MSLGYIAHPGGEPTRAILRRGTMSHWYDTMVDRPKAEGAVYATGWTISGLAVLGAIVAVWVLGI